MSEHESLDNTSQHSSGKRKDSASEEGARKRRKKKHRVVIHTSPFLRCLQTSVAIAAGMAQFQPPQDPASRPGTAKPRTPGQLHSASPRMRAADGVASPNLAPIAEPKHDLAHAIAKRMLQEHRRHRKAKLRVDAFLGEWLNPQYFDQITPPPPSPMMLATAKAELIQNEAVDIFTPTSSKSSTSSLWGGGANGQSLGSRDSALEEWSEVQEALSPPTPKRDRSNSVSSVESSEGNSGRRSPYRPGGVLQPFSSTVPKPEHSVYVPPLPQYAVSGSDHIPRGYVSHARQACTNADYQWDSSRPPQDWGDGGEYGEEWSAMHKRFRRGLNKLVHWYGQNDTDERAEDALGMEQVERHEDEEEEDLVVILVTHGAGSNALIGALTAQPVLLDVGMASLTMAVRRDDAPPLPPIQPLTNGHGRRFSLDMGLSAMYEMKLVSSSEHLRPGADPSRALSMNRAAAVPNARDGFAHRAQRFGTSTSEGSGMLDPHTRNRSSTNSALGTIRRPSAVNLAAPTSTPPGPGNLTKSNTMPVGADLDFPTVKFTGGLWTPPASRTPLLEAEVKGKEDSVFSKLSDSARQTDSGQNMVLDFSNSPPDSRPTSSSGPPAPAPAPEPVPSKKEVPKPRALALALNGGFDGAQDRDSGSNSPELPNVAAKPPQAISRGLSQKGLGLWGSKPAGDKVARKFLKEPKRRWTVNQDDAGEY